METERWVRRLNLLAWKIEEVETTVHPSAWPEQLKGLHAAFRKEARRFENE